MTNHLVQSNISCSFFSSKYSMYAWLCSTLTDRRLSFNGSEKLAILYKPFTFNCTLTEAENLTDSIQLFRKKRNGYASVLIKQQKDICTIHRVLKPWNASCGHGTNSSSSHVKSYLFTLELPGEKQVGIWWCACAVLKITSNHFYLNITGMCIHLDYSAVFFLSHSY